MYNSYLRTKPGHSNVVKFVMTLVFTVVIGGLSMVPAFGQGYGRYPENAEHREYRRERHEEHREAWRERHEEHREAWRERHAERRWRAHQPYGYATPLYTPPPVVYAPAPSPGINLFFHIR